MGKRGGTRGGTRCGTRRSASAGRRRPFIWRQLRLICAPLCCSAAAGRVTGCAMGPAHWASHTAQLLALCWTQIPLRIRSAPNTSGIVVKTHCRYPINCKLQRRTCLPLVFRPGLIFVRSIAPTYNCEKLAVEKGVTSAIHS